jgi:hypothetical protein
LGADVTDQRKTLHMACGAKAPIIWTQYGKIFAADKKSF